MDAVIERVTLTKDDIPVTYSVTDAKIAEFRQSCAGLSADTPQGYDEVRLAIGRLRDTRVAVEKRRVELKADALAFGRKVDSEAKRLTGLLEAIEEPLKTKKQAVDDEKARVKAAEEEAKIAALREEIRANEARQVAERKAAQEAEDQRLSEERARLAEERAALDADRKAADARAAAERAQVEAAQRAERTRLDAERAALEADRRAVAAARETVEREAFERQARVRAEQEAADTVERERIAADRARAEAAERDADAAARAEALKPDVEKVAAFADALRAIVPPVVRTDEAKSWIAITMRAIGDAAMLLDYNAGGF